MRKFLPRCNILLVFFMLAACKPVNSETKSSAIRSEEGGQYLAAVGMASEASGEPSVCLYESYLPPQQLQANIKALGLKGGSKLSDADEFAVHFQNFTLVPFFQNETPRKIPVSFLQPGAMPSSSAATSLQLAAPAKIVGAVVAEKAAVFKEEVLPTVMSKAHIGGFKLALLWPDLAPNMYTTTTPLGAAQSVFASGATIAMDKYGKIVVEAVDRLRAKAFYKMQENIGSLEQGLPKLDLAGSGGVVGAAQNTSAQVSKPAELTKEQLCKLSNARINKLQVSNKKALPQDIQEAHDEIQKMIEGAQNSAKAQKKAGVLCPEQMPLPQTQIADCTSTKEAR